MKDKFKQLALVLALFAFIQTNSFGQDGYSVVTRDLETWSRVGLQFKPLEKFSFRIDQGLRFNHNSTQLDQALTQLSFKVKPIKPIYFGMGLRYIYDRGGNDLFDNDFRIHLDAGVKHKFKRFTFDYRLRYQNRNEIGLTTDEGDYFKNYLRLRTKVDYNIKNWKLDPYISAEIFRDLTRYTGGFDTFRWTVGTNYKTEKFGKFGLYYRMERELFESYPKTTNIIGLNYTYTINRKKK